MHSSGCRIVLTDVDCPGITSTDVVVFDCLTGSDLTSRLIDPVNLLLLLSDELALYSVRQVVLATNSEKKFSIASSGLRRIAASFAGSRRVWGLNNMPVSVNAMAGMHAFVECIAGCLTVLRTQTDDLGTFFRG